MTATPSAGKPSTASSLRYPILQTGLRSPCQFSDCPFSAVSSLFAVRFQSKRKAIRSGGFVCVFEIDEVSIKRKSRVWVSRTARRGSDDFHVRPTGQDGI